MFIRKPTKPRICLVFVQGALLVITCLLSLGVTPGGAQRAMPKEQGSLMFFASPTGSGDGRSLEKPFRIADFWNVAAPGSTLWLLDGRYRGDEAMLVPPPAVRGLSGRPVTIRALHEGMVLLDGEGVRRPIYLRGNSYVTVEGVNACCSKSDVVYLSDTTGVAIRRVVGWNAGEGYNAMIFSIAYGAATLLEDTAGFGSARKTYQYFHTDGPATIRRAWAEWNWSLNKGPKAAFSLVYSSRNLTAENVIGTWRALMPARYTLLDGGKPYIAGEWSDYNRGRTICGPGQIQADGTCLVSEGLIDQMDGILTAESSFRGLTNRRTNSRYLGSLAYVVPGVDTTQLPRLVYASQVEGVALENVAAYWAANPSNKDAFLLGNCSNADAPACGNSNWNLSARGLTAFGGPIHFSRVPPTQWESSNLASANSPSELYGSSGASIFAPGAKAGANLCFQYRDGKITDQPLWPWPMNERIKKAMVEAGRQPVDVTATIEELFGQIPVQCRSDRERAASMQPPGGAPGSP